MGSGLQGEIPLRSLGSAARIMGPSSSSALDLGPRARLSAFSPILIPYGSPSGIGGTPQKNQAIFQKYLDLQGIKKNGLHFNLKDLKAVLLRTLDVQVLLRAIGLGNGGVSSQQGRDRH